MSITVFAPASIGNFSVGYDLLGAAVQPINDELLGDTIEVSANSHYAIDVKGAFQKQLPNDPAHNIVHHCHQLFHQRLEQKQSMLNGITSEPLKLTLHKNLPVGSGLGSSSSSIVAAITALNLWYDSPFSKNELLLMMGDMEAQISGSLHYDNIAPCFLGGLQLMTGNDNISKKLPWYEDWYIVIANPGTNILTKDARDAIPATMKLTDATLYAQHLANFVQSLYEEDKQSSKSHLNDVVAEPYRQHLLPNYNLHKEQLLDLGAKAVGISGSGPTLFAICHDLKTAESAHDYLSQNYHENDQAFSHICQLCHQGAQVINESKSSRRSSYQRENRMPFVNINKPQQVVSFEHALLNPVGDDGGIYMPQDFPQIPDELRYSGHLQQISEHILSSLIQDEIPQKELSSMIKRAFNFPIKLRSLSNSHHVLELFHGPTLAFKDFGARFLAECLHYFKTDKMTIVTATSGDTGAAVANAFHGLDNIDVVVLYPDGKISKEQEQLFCTLGGNIHTIKVDGDFDACQSLVKQAFNNPELNKNLKLNSANSINIARLLAQICYYAVLPGLLKAPIDSVVVPCGNFGNLTAGLIAKKMGVPINRFVAATNSNDTVPRYFSNKQWLPNPTVRTISNAMDVSQPNNFSRILNLYHDKPNQLMEHVSAISINEAQTKQVIRFQDQKSYQVDPHTAVGIHGFQHKPDVGHQVRHQVVVSTAHPAKFADVLEEILDTTIERPDTITQAMSRPNLSIAMDNSFHAFKNYLLALN